MTLPPSVGHGHAGLILTMLGIGLAVGSVAGALVLSWWMLRTEDESFNRALREKDAEIAKLAGELKAMLGQRREQCFKAYSNGLALGMRGRKRRRRLVPLPSQPELHS